MIPSSPPGVTVIGDLSSDIGLSEAARRYVDAMVRSGIPVDYAEIPYMFPNRVFGPLPEWLRGLSRGATHDINLLVHSFVDLHELGDISLNHLTRGRYTIGLWFWELPRVPARFQRGLHVVDELWVASKFTAANLRVATAVPMSVIPIPIEVITSSTVDRRSFGLPQNRYVFLASFDAASSDGRKNPWGAIHAFAQAFGPQHDDGPLLVVKANHLELFPELKASMESEIVRLGGVLLQESYSRQQMNDLLACADCYASLHRAEGFGLGIAESMYLGKPVIATYYSGNADFMTPENSFPVGCQLRAVVPSDHAYNPFASAVFEVGQLWAEPDIEQAAWWMRYVYENQDFASRRGVVAADYSRRHHAPHVVGQRIAQRLDALRTQSAHLREKRSVQAGVDAGTAANRVRKADFGLHIVGDLTVDAGLGSAARNMTHAIVHRGLPVAYTEFAYPFERKVIDDEIVRSLPPADRDYAFNLLYYNFAELAACVSPEELARLTGGRYTIGFWFWELPRVPNMFRPQFDRVDEIWVASEYTKQNLRMVTDTCVTVMPVPVQVPISLSPDRTSYGIPRDRFVFLYTFSVASSIGRKNPWGVLDAFEEAFGPGTGSGPLLVLKAHHVDIFPDVQMALRERVARVGGILLEESYSRQQMNDLLACADCYASLHRAEGFGLGIAESMYLGKPVIATYYSGNADFMTPENSFPVGYQLRPIIAEDHCFDPGVAGLYRPGQLWAEPDIEQAAWWMRYVYENFEAAQGRGQEAAVHMRRHFSHDAVGQRIEERLVTLYRSHEVRPTEQMN